VHLDCVGNDNFLRFDEKWSVSRYRSCIFWYYSWALLYYFN